MMDVKQILESDSFQDAVEGVRVSIIQEWESSQSSDATGREECYRELHALKLLINKLRAQLEDQVFKQKETK